MSMRFALLVALFALVIGSASPQSNWTTAVPGIDFPNDNLGPPIPLSIVNFTLCQQACASNSSCIAFSIGSTNLSVPFCVSKPCCFLKSTLSTSVTNTYMTSYLPAVAGEVVNAAIPPYFKLQGYGNVGGTPLKQLWSQTLQTCITACATTFGCNGFLYLGSTPNGAGSNGCLMSAGLTLPIGPFALDMTNPAFRAVGVVYQTTVITGGRQTYGNLAPGYQRASVHTGSFGSYPSGDFNFGTGCGVNAAFLPDFVSEICLASNGASSSLQPLRFTFSSGYSVTCNLQAGLTTCASNMDLWSPSSSAAYIAPTYFSPSQCLEISTVTSEVISSMSMSSNNDNQHFAGLNIATTQGQSWSATSTPGGNPPHISSPSYSQISTLSIQSLDADLKTYQGSMTSSETVYKNFVDNTVSSGLLCGIAGEFAINSNVIESLAMLFMLPLSPSMNPAFASSTAPLPNIQPPSSGTGSTFSVAFNDIICNTQGTLGPEVTVSLTTNSNLQTSTETQVTNGLNTNKILNTGGSIGYGNLMEYGGITVSSSYTRTIYGFSSDTRSSTSGSGSSASQTISKALPFTCPSGPNYNEVVQCTFKASASESFIVGSTPWTGNVVYTLVSGATFNSTIGGVYSGNYVNGDVSVVSTKCNGVYYTSMACQAPAGSIMACGPDNTIYTTKQMYNRFGQGTQLQIYPMSPDDYHLAGSPPPFMFIETCAEIQQACGNLAPSPPPPPSSPPPPPFPAPPPSPPSPQAAQVNVSSYNQMVQVAQLFAEAHLVLGNGWDAGYQNVSDVFNLMQPYFQMVQDRIISQYGSVPFLVVWGGEQPTGSNSALPLSPAQPDMGSLIQMIRSSFNCRVLTVSQKVVSNQTTCDYCFEIDQQLDANNNTVYAGVSGGKLLGASSYYLSSDFVGTPNQGGILTSVWVAGGGGNQLNELKYVSTTGTPYRYFPAAAATYSAYGSLMGSIDAIMHSVLIPRGLVVQLSDNSTIGNTPSGVNN